MQPAHVSLWLRPETVPDSAVKKGSTLMHDKPSA